MSNDFLNESGFERAIARIARRIAEIASVNPADVVEGLLNDDDFKNKVLDTVSGSDKLVQDIINDPRLRERIAKDILESHPTLIQDVTHLLVNSSELHNLIVEMALSTSTFIEAVTNTIVNDETFINDIKQAILNDSTLVQNIANQILETIASLSMVDPDGNEVAERDGNAFKFQAANNERFGLIKGQKNDSAETWHLISIINGLASINRAGLVAFIEAKIKAGGGETGGGGGITYADVMDILNKIRLLAPDGSPVGTNVNGNLTIQQGTPKKFGLCKPRRNSPCSPQKTSWRTMDDALVSETKHDIHMFAPFSFPKEMPRRINLFDRLTFIPINAGKNCGAGCHNGSNNPVASKDFVQDFTVNAYDPEKDFIQDFTIPVISAKDYTQDFAVNAVDPKKDFTQDFIVSVIPTKDFTQDFKVNAVDPAKDFTQDFDVHGVRYKDFTQDFVVTAMAQTTGDYSGDVVIIWVTSDVFTISPIGNMTHYIASHKFYNGSPLELTFNSIMTHMWTHHGTSLTGSEVTYHANSNADIIYMVSPLTHKYIVYVIQDFSYLTVNGNLTSSPPFPRVH